MKETTMEKVLPEFEAHLWPYNVQSSHFGLVKQEDLLTIQFIPRM